MGAGLSPTACSEVISDCSGPATQAGNPGFAHGANSCSSAPGESAFGSNVYAPRALEAPGSPAFDRLPLISDAFRAPERQASTLDTFDTMNAHGLGAGHVPFDALSVGGSPAYPPIGTLEHQAVPVVTMSAPYGQALAGKAFIPDTSSCISNTMSQSLDSGYARGFAQQNAQWAQSGQAGQQPIGRDDIVTLNVGGEKIVQRRRSTLCAAKGSFLGARFGGYSHQASVWRYDPFDGNVIGIRTVPDIDGPKSGNKMWPGDVFRVSQEFEGNNGVLFLRLDDGRGWVFDRKPGWGIMCVRHEEADRDIEGRYFINYSPEVFMPLLDYLTMKETEDPSYPAPLPRGPDHLRPQFEAMLRFFGVLPTVGAADSRHLAMGGWPYFSAPWWAYGLAFEVRARTHPVSITALETCAVAQDASAGVSCTVHACEGPLEHRLNQRNAWMEAGRGVLFHRRASRIEFAQPVLVRANIPHCIYIAMDAVGTGSGVAFGAPLPAGVSAANDDLEVLAGHFSTRFDDFSTGAFYPFNGKLEYAVLA